MTSMLDQIHEGEAPAEVAGLFRDIRRELRLTYVPLLFRTLAAHRGALRAVWEQLRPNVATRAFETLADELRARLATQAVDLGVPLIEPVLSSVGLDVDEIDEIREQVDLFHYADPKVLLCVGALEGLVRGSPVGGHLLRAELLATLPEGAPPDVPELALMPEEPGGVVGELFHEVIRTLGLPVAEIDLRALGHWPPFVDAAWREVGGPMFGHPHLQPALDELLDSVRMLAGRLPFRVDPNTGLLADHPETGAAGGRVVSQLGGPLLRLALFAAALKVSLDGAQAALDSPFPVSWEEPMADQLELP